MPVTVAKRRGKHRETRDKALRQVRAINRGLREG